VVPALSSARRLAAASTLAILAACSGGGEGSPDAGASSPDGGRPPDPVEIDAAVVDCAGDHRESRGVANDPITMQGGTAEATGLALTADSEPFTVCGELDPADANMHVVDADTYQFKVTGSEPVAVRLTMSAPTGAALPLRLDLYLVDEGIPVLVGTGRMLTGRALVAGLPLEPGTYWASAVALYPVPEAVVPYTLTLARDTRSCPPPEGAPDHVESGDGGDSRGNDVVSILYPGFTLTEDGGDQPEDTDLVLVPADEGEAPVHLRGTSGDVGSAGDDYLDRDTYLVEAGATTAELEVRLTWPDGDVDLDALLFPAGAPGSYAPPLGPVIGEQTDEVFTAAVEPGQAYWLWIGAFDDREQGGAQDLPVTYDVTVCPRAIAP